MPRGIKCFTRTVSLLATVAIFIAFFSLPVSVARASALSDAAASMQPGTWLKLATNNTSVMIKPNGGDILEYSNRGAWDPAGQLAYFCGASHHGSFYNDCVRYDAATNSWSSIGVPPGVCKDNCPPDTVVNLIHGYDHNAFDTKRGIFYFRQGGSAFKYNGSSWSQTARMPGNCGDPSSVAEVLEYFPNIDRIVFLSPYCTTGAVYYNPDTNSWSEPAASLPNGGYSLEGAYSKSGILYGGCGVTAKTQLSRVDANGQWQAVATPPAPCYILASLLVADPSTGQLLFFAGSGNIYELDAVANNWTNTGITSQFPINGSAIVIPISNYGVTMLVKTINSQSAVEVWLYKHSTSANSIPPVADTSAPSTPTNLAAIVLSSSQINLSWSASTDNVGVTGYTVERCQGNGCANFTQIATTGVSYSDTNLAANTFYSYRVRAFDAAGNLSSHSNVASATTQPSSTVSSDFSARCGQPGVIKCIGFDSSADLAGTYGSPYGVLAGPKASPTIDTATKASGNGSLKFTISAGWVGGDAGSYFTNFSNDLLTQIGENSEFYIQYRVRMTPEFIAAGNFKTSIIGTGDKPGCTPSTSAGGSCYSSCTALEVVVQTPYDSYKYPVMYNSCTGSTHHGPYDAFQEPYGSYDYKMQNARPSPYCTYQQTKAGQQFPPTGNCFGHFPNEWMTFQVHVKTGPRVNDEFTNSYVELWMAREGKPSEPVVSWGPYYLTAGSTMEDQKYGKIWLLPYSGGSVFPSNSYVWYDELIISRSRIPDPGITQSAQPPAAPTGLTLK